MNYHNEPNFIKEPLNVLAKFGYLRKEFFWKYLSPKSRSCKFRNWKLLIGAGYLEAYKRSFIGEDVYKLSKKAKRVLSNAGVHPVSSAHPLHFEHDDNVINFALAAEKKELIANWISEKELRQTPASEINQLFGSSLNKLPDLIFQIKSGSHNLRGVLEIERTRKSKARYDSFVNSYSKAAGVDLILLAYCDKSVFDSVRNSMKRLSYPDSLRPIAFCKISDLHKDWTNFPILIGDKIIPFEQYVQNLRDLDSSKFEMDFQSDGRSLFFTENICV